MIPPVHVGIAIGGALHRRPETDGRPSLYDEERFNCLCVCGLGDGRPNERALSHRRTTHAVAERSDRRDLRSEHIF